MASSGTKERSSPARRARPQTSKNGQASANNQSPARRAKEGGKENGRASAKNQSPARRAKAAGSANGGAVGKNESPARRAKAAGKPNGGGGGKHQSATRRAKEAVKPAKEAVTPGGGSLKSKLIRKVAGKAAKRIALKALRSTASAVRLAADRTASVGKNAVEAGVSKRLPIQVSIDVAVPLKFAWDEWHDFGSIPEGVHRIEDVERDGDSLFGRLSGPRSADWEAEIIDEREEESFAWRSVTGTDTAGLVTFHRLSDRLTRIELDLDVLPTNPAEALTMASHMAHRRAEADLRRFKAHVEFINPDVYESESGQNGSSG